jgi:hypothetical protein
VKINPRNERLPQYIRPEEVGPPPEMGRLPRGQAAGGWNKLPTINQLKPNGAQEAGYKNGVYNCGPAAAAMIARGLGTMGHLSDAQLIQKLSSGRTTNKGTSVENMGKMLEFVGAKVDKGTVVGRYKEGMVAENLAKGNKVLAQVGVNNRDTGKVDAHYVVIDKTDGKGNFLVKDPLKGESWVSERELKTAFERAPNGGGALIPVSNPKAPQAQDATARELRTDGFGGRRAPPVGDTGQDRFETSAADTEGADETFEASAEDLDDEMRRNDAEVDNDLVDSVLGHDDANPNDGSLVPEDLSAKDYADTLVNLLTGQDAGQKGEAEQVFERLRKSTGPKEKEAFKLVTEEMLKRKSGIGSRRMMQDSGG